MSTEAVFDGKQELYTESSITRPISWYGTSKAVAEHILQESSPIHSIIRAVISYYPDTNPATIYGSLLRSLQTKKSFGAVDDHYMTPTFIPDLNKAISAITSNSHSGVFHLTPSQVVTPYQFAQMMAQFLGYDEKLIEPRSLITFLGEERAKLRVKYACLDTTVTSEVLGIVPQNLGDVLSTL
jgi:dTDP-4-dehydrorhamnose reductase